MNYRKLSRLLPLNLFWNQKLPSLRVDHVLAIAMNDRNPKCRDGLR